MVDVEHRMALSHRTPSDVGHVDIESCIKFELKDVSSSESISYNPCYADVFSVSMSIIFIHALYAPIDFDPCFLLFSFLSVV